jgi:hypothetical protein
MLHPQQAAEKFRGFFYWNTRSLNFLLVSGPLRRSPLDRPDAETKSPALCQNSAGICNILLPVPQLLLVYFKGSHETTLQMKKYHSTLFY